MTVRRLLIVGQLRLTYKAAYSNLEHSDSEYPTRLQPSQPSEADRTFFAESPNIYYLNPPTFWDPTRQGPVPGYWQAAFDQSAQRWVHTWQPLS